MKIFISYSRKDKIYKNRLLSSLSKLEEDRIAQIWVDDRKLRVGDGIDDVIEKELLTSDIFVLLLSENFWNSDYIKIHEFPEIQKRHRKDNCRIIPIVLKDTKDLLEYPEIKKKLAIPQGKGIVDFKPQSKIFNKVYDALKNIILFQDIGSNYHLLYLCRHSLEMLSPYMNFYELAIKNIQFNSENKSWNIEFNEYLENQKNPVLKVLNINYNEEEKKLFDEYFKDIYFKPKAPLVKLKDKFLEQKVINRAEILNILNITYDRLFPRISKIETIKEYIQTQDICNLQNSIQHSKSRKLLVYGNAGIGKTSTLSSLQYFSPDDIVIIYDSFGAGTYKDDGEKRHKEKYIRIQIINEIAIRLGLNPYVENELYDLEEEFLKYIQIASKLLANNKIIIIIDAADNNVDGANTFHDDIFVPKLWSLNLPDNCYLIMSSRGYRKYLLNQNSDVEEVELKGFDKESSLKFLLKTFSFVDKDLHENFYKKTNGNPRLQSYLLNNIDNDYKRLKDILEGTSKLSLDDIFEDIWLQATAVIQPSTKKHLEELICLARPATIENFTLASGMLQEDSLKVIDILSPGITLKNQNQIGFLDEDFEIFLLNKLSVQNKLEAYKRVSTNLIEKITEDEYSAKHIALFLMNAQDYDTLIGIALDSDLECIEDRLQRIKVERDRVKKALKISYQQKKTKELLKLLFKIALLFKSDESLNEILQEENLDLLAIYTSNDNAIKVLTKHQTNLGAFAYHCAYLLAKDNPQKALEYIEQGDVWLNEYLKKDEEERRVLELNPIDIAKKMATIYYIKSFKEAYVSLKYFGWNLWFAFKVIDSLPKAFLKDIAIFITYNEYKIFLKKVHPFIQAIFLVKLNKSIEQEIDSLIVHAVSKELNEFILSKNGNIELSQSNFSEREDSNKISVDFIELASLHRVDREILLSFIGIAKIKDFMSLHDAHSLRYYEDTLYLLALNSNFKKKAIKLNEILEKEIRAKSDYDKKREMDEKKSLVNTLLPYYELLVEVITIQSSFKDIEKKWNMLLKNDLGHMYYHARDTWIYSLRAIILTKILVITKAEKSAFESLVKYCKNIYTKKRVCEILLEYGYLQYAFELIEIDTEREMKEASPSYEKLSFFIEYVKLLKEYDLDRARYYFELALEAVHGLDDNAFYLYKIIALYSNYASESITESQKIELANKHISLAESTSGYLDRTSHALTEFSFEAVANLDISIALNLSRRWHDSITYRLDNSSIELVDILIKKELLTPTEAFSFKYFIKNSSVSNLFINVLNSLKGNTKTIISLLESMRDFIRKHLLSSEQLEVSERLIKWLEENELTSHKITLELKEFCKFYHEIKPQNKSETDWLKKEPVDWDKFYKSHQGNILDKFQEAITIGYRDINNTLVEFEKRVSTEDRMKYMEFIVNDTKNNYHKSEYGKALLYLIDKWKFDKNIRKSKSILIREFIVKNYEMFITSYQCKNCVEEFSKYIDKEEIVYIVLEQIVENPFYIGYMERFVDVFDLIKNIIEPHATYEVVQNFMKSFETRIDIQNVELENEENSIDTVIRYLYKLMGHSDRRIRYKSIHTSRALIKENILLIPIFLEQLTLENGFPFNDDYSYYPIASKESLLTVFHRLSNEIIEHLKDFIRIFFQIAIDNDFPHVIIRHIAKQIVLNILEKYPSLLDSGEKVKLTLTNESNSSYIGDEHRYRCAGYDTRDVKRFDFDSMDTIPYWYDSLCRIFKIDMEKVLEKAEEWIVDKWGINTRQELERIQVWDRDEGYYLKDHRHGDIPTVEEPVRHIEFHSMFLVAGEFLQKYSTHLEHYWDKDKDWYECQYQDFLNRYFDESKEIYYEQRDAKPLDLLLWGKFDKNISDERYYNLLEVLGDSLVLRAHYSIYTEEYSEYVSIFSALVSSKNAKSLQNAFQNTRVHDFWLPFKSDDNGEIDENEFKLLSWLVENNDERRGNKKDPYSHGQETYRYLPCDEFMSLCEEEDMKIENWADEDQGNRIYEPSSSGYKIHISRRSITKYLQNKNMDMIIQVELTVNDKKSEDKFNKTFQIFILRQDGSIEKYEESIYSEHGGELLKENFSDEYSIDTYGRWLLFEIAKVEIDIKEKYSKNLENEHQKLIDMFKNRQLTDY